MDRNASDIVMFLQTHSNPARPSEFTTICPCCLMLLRR